MLKYKQWNYQELVLQLQLKLQQVGTVNTTSTAQNAFIKTALASAFNVPLNKNFQFSLPQIICSQVNETNEPTLAGAQIVSHLHCSLTSTVSNLSPVIDEQRRGVITVGNRVNQINSSF